MAYKSLYEFVQPLPIHIKRTIIRQKVGEICENPIRVIRTGIDTQVCRGYYLSPKNTDHPMVKAFGCPLVLIARDQNRCWQRFVEFKELMHAFDDPAEAADTGEKFDRLIAEFAGAGSLNRSPEMNSEIKAFWMALGVACPEARRLEFEAQRKDGATDDYSIALQIRIPELYVPALFEPWYRSLIDGLIN